MEEQPDLAPGTKSWLLSVRENLRDHSRTEAQTTDTPAMKAARKYLHIRLRRSEIENIGGATGASPYRLVEIVRARKLAGMLGVEFESHSQLDDLMPTLARMQLEDLPPPPEI